MRNNPRLDRLSALLEGLAPRVEVIQFATDLSEITVAASAEQSLHVYVLTHGQMHLHIASHESAMVTAPAIVVCHANTAHALKPVSQEGLQNLMCLKAFMAGPIASLLLREFVEAHVVPLEQTDPSLRHVIGLISAELLQPRCGQSTLLDRAGDILFIGLLRHLIAHPKNSQGLFSGLADPRIALSLVAIHTKPQDNWTLARLAEEAGMSRTSFAVTFRDVMNQPPGKYLSNIRMSLARRAVQSGKGLKQAARYAGYASTSALSRALSKAEKRNPTAHPILSAL